MVSPRFAVGCTAALMAMLMAPAAVAGESRGDVTTTASAPSSPQYPEFWISTTSVNVAWERPWVTGDSGTLTYTARAWSTVPPTLDSNLVASCTTTSMGCTISGLTAGTFYYIDIVATNSSGTGNPSAYQQVQPGTTATAPRNVEVAGGAGQVTVRWQTPTSLGTGSFAWYSAAAFRGPAIGAGTAITNCTSGAAQLTCTIAGLVNGRTYYIGVAAVTSQHAGTQSPRVKVVAGSRPSAPRHVTASPRDHAARVTWRVPLTTGGLAITGYRLRLYRHGQATIIRRVVVSADARSRVLRHLRNGRAYDVTVAALNSLGEGKRSPRVTVTPRSA